MGVYIKGMDMSEIENLVLTKNVQLVFCWTSHMTLTVKTKTESKDGIISYSKEFEVVKVPEPHGSLIDADELKTAFPRRENGQDVKIASVRATINHMPTVIEAEK